MSIQTEIQEIADAPKACLPRELVSNTAFLLARVGIAIKLAAHEELEKLGCSLYDYGVLAMLGEGTRETQAAVADALGLDRSMLVGILDGLEEGGLIERTRDPKDRRRHTVSITQKGKRRLVELREVTKEIEQAFLEPLDASTRKQLHEALFRVACAYDPRYEIGAGT